MKRLINAVFYPCMLLVVVTGGCAGGAVSSANAAGSAQGDDILTYPIVETGQTDCYDNSGKLWFCPKPGEAFYGQASQTQGRKFNYTDNGDGTITDNVTGLIWQKSPDQNGDGRLDYSDKRTLDQALAEADGFSLAGYDDWRLPTIKELYSLINFNGMDSLGPNNRGGDSPQPFIDDNYFDFAYGDENAGERMIDSQYASSTLYVSNKVTRGMKLMFGVNFADGRIKGYGLKNRNGDEKKFFIMYVRGAEGYGRNAFSDNHDGTITDKATGLMWSQYDSGRGMDWEDALAWVQRMNTENYLGHNDWRLPNAKELQSIVDYGRSPDVTGSAAVDPLFRATSITDERGERDFPWYWAGDTHINAGPKPGMAAVYVAFGRALGYMHGRWIDVHGAGAQRSDPKSGNPARYPHGRGPQGDAIRINNFVRLVRNAN